VGGLSPDPRASHHAVALDDRRMAVFAGFDGSEFLSDLWLLHVEPGEAPADAAAAAGASAAQQQRQDDAGAAGAAAAPQGESLAFRWERIARGPAQAQQQPAAALGGAGAGAAGAAGGQRVGGAGAAAAPTGAGTAAAAAAVAGASSAPEPRSGGGIVYHRDCLVVYGGRCRRDGRVTFSDAMEIYSFAAGCWREVPASGSVPAPRKCFAFAHEGSRMWVLGGLGAATTYFSDVHCLDLDVAVERAFGPAAAAAAGAGVLGGGSSSRALGLAGAASPLVGGSGDSSLAAFGASGIPVPPSTYSQDMLSLVHAAFAQALQLAPLTDAVVAALGPAQRRRRLGAAGTCDGSGCCCGGCYEDGAPGLRRGAAPLADACSPSGRVIDGSGVPQAEARQQQQQPSTVHAAGLGGDSGALGPREGLSSVAAPGRRASSSSLLLRPFLEEGQAYSDRDFDAYFSAAAASATAASAGGESPAAPPAPAAATQTSALLAAAPALSRRDCPRGLWQSAVAGGVTLHHHHAASEDDAVRCGDPYALAAALGADVLFEVEGRLIPLHRAILSARCGYFRAMLSSRWGRGGALAMTPSAPTPSQLLRLHSFSPSASGAGAGPGGDAAEEEGAMQGSGYGLAPTPLPAAAHGGAAAPAGASAALPVVPLPDMGLAAFFHVAHYLYSDALPASFEVGSDGLELLEQAQKLDLTRLSLACQRELACYIADDTVCDMLRHADLLHATALRWSCLRYILQHFDRVTAQPAFIALPEPVLREVLVRRSKSLQPALAQAAAAAAASEPGSGLGSSGLRTPASAASSSASAYGALAASPSPFMPSRAAAAAAGLVHVAQPHGGGQRAGQQAPQPRAAFALGGAGPVPVGPSAAPASSPLSDAPLAATAVPTLDLAARPGQALDALAGAPHAGGPPHLNLFPAAFRQPSLGAFPAAREGGAGQAGLPTALQPPRLATAAAARAADAAAAGEPVPSGAGAPPGLSALVSPMGGGLPLSGSAAAGTAGAPTAPAASPARHPAPSRAASDAESHAALYNHPSLFAAAARPEQLAAGGVPGFPPSPLAAAPAAPRPAAAAVGAGALSGGVAAGSTLVARRGPDGALAAAASMLPGEGEGEAASPAAPQGSHAAPILPADAALNEPLSGAAHHAGAGSPHATGGAGARAAAGAEGGDADRDADASDSGNVSADSYE